MYEVDEMQDKMERSALLGELRGCGSTAFRTVGKRPLVWLVLSLSLAAALEVLTRLPVTQVHVFVQYLVPEKE